MIPLENCSGCRSQVVVSSWSELSSHGFETLCSYQVEKLLPIKSVVVQSPHVGVAVKSSEWMSAQMSSSSFDCGSNLQDPSPIAFKALHREK
ncbi:hypothetical protein TNCT_586901 [Trichonephila clavata]|uniref:Uncharacterized protein n=1 Tax=Trichonephila clavata TaxID=2740835 RepID=A0A8X6L937_TRICU|nr:hypothetical protein TNCT_586901 [Trichonephila clavata]